MKTNFIDLHLHLDGSLYLPWQYEKALEINPRNAFVYNNLGAVYDDEEDYETAIKYYKKATRSL